MTSPLASTARGNIHATRRRQHQRPMQPCGRVSYCALAYTMRVDTHRGIRQGGAIQAVLEDTHHRARLVQLLRE